MGKGDLTDLDIRSPEAATALEHRAAHRWLINNAFGEREIALQTHLVLIDILAALEKIAGKK